MSRQVTVKCLYVYKGEQWPIDVHGFVAEDKQVTDALPKMVRWLKSVGLRPLPVTLDRPVNVSPNGLPPVVTCPVHHREMKPSKYTKKGYVASWYCTDKIGNEYCKHQAHITADGVLDYTS